MEQEPPNTLKLEKFKELPELIKKI
jgi:hypothetical protein